MPLFIANVIREGKNRFAQSRTERESKTEEEEKKMPPERKKTGIRQTGRAGEMEKEGQENDR